MEPIYAWQRFWVPPDRSIDYSDGGFLLDPESEQARYSAQKLYTLPALQHFRALACSENRVLGNPSRWQLIPITGTARKPR
jgi:hypothetical protein